MWPFKRKTTNQRLAQKALGIAGENPPTANEIAYIHDWPMETGTHNHDAADPLTAALQSATDAIASETPREVIRAADKETVEFHVASIRGILESVASRRQSLTESRQLRRTQFEADDATDAAKIAELDRLTAVYRAALDTACPVDGHAPAPWPPGHQPPPHRDTFTVPDGFEAVRDTEGRATGEVRPITKPRRRKPMTARVNQGAIGAIDMG